jgi:hypothetical protein
MMTVTSLAVIASAAPANPAPAFKCSTVESSVMSMCSASNIKAGSGASEQDAPGFETSFTTR